MKRENKTTNCHIRDAQKGDVYCGRGKGAKINPANCRPGENGYFGNPVATGRKCPVCGGVHRGGGSTLACYEKYLRERLENDGEFRSRFFRLKGKRLACFCKPGPCHTDVMIRILDEENPGGRDGQK